MIYKMTNKLGNLLKNNYRFIFNFGANKTKDLLGNCNVVETGIVSEELLVPDYIVKPAYYFSPMKPSSTVGKIEIKTKEQIDHMRVSCKLAANILKKCEEIVKSGITTDDIDKFVHQKIIDSNAYPSPLRYGGFPKSVCTSVNNVACHGIPDNRPLMDGDIVNVDITVFFNGYHGDCSRTFMVGNVDERGQFLVKVTEECLMQAVKYCRPNRPFNGIGKIIESHANRNRLNVIKDFIGHGIGSYFHGPPEILHFGNRVGGVMQQGMTFTIEPILALGDSQLELLEDGWTAVTEDNSRSAQFEHTVLITDDSVDILTLPD